MYPQIGYILVITYFLNFGLYSLCFKSSDQRARSSKPSPQQTVKGLLYAPFFSTKQVVKWNEMKILQRVLENKLIFIETKDNEETVLALENYK